MNEKSSREEMEKKHTWREKEVKDEGDEEEERGDNDIYQQIGASHKDRLKK